MVKRSIVSIVVVCGLVLFCFVSANNVYRIIRPDCVQDFVQVQGSGSGAVPLQSNISVPRSLPVAERPHIKPLFSDTGRSIVPAGRAFEFQHEYLLFCQLEAGLVQERLLLERLPVESGTREPAHLLWQQWTRALHQLKTCLIGKLLRVEDGFHEELLRSLLAILEQVSQCESESSDSVMLNELLNSARHIFQRLLCADLDWSHPLSAVDRDLAAREAVSRCFTDLFRWTVEARRQLRPDFIRLDGLRDIYYRSIFEGLCLQYNYGHNGLHFYSGRINDRSAPCDGGIYFEVDMTTRGRLARIFFELD